MYEELNNKNYQVLTKPPYKSCNNVWYTRQLFFEPWQHINLDTKTIRPVFSLHQDLPGLINVRKTFVELKDVTGHDWAIRYLGSYEHYSRLMTCTWFKEATEEYIEEIKVLIRKEALQKLIEISEGAGPQAASAARYLANYDWEKANTRGRPSKEELKGELKRAAHALTEEQEDMKRIGLGTFKIIEGGKNHA